MPGCCHRVTRKMIQLALRAARCQPGSQVDLPLGGFVKVERIVVRSPIKPYRTTRDYYRYYSPWKKTYFGWTNHQEAVQRIRELINEGCYRAFQPYP